MQNRPGKINFDHSPPFFDTKPLRQKPLFPGFGSLCTVLPTLCHHWTNRPPLLCKRKETINQGPLHTKIKLSWTGNALSKSSSSTRNSRARFRIPQNPRDGQFENRWFIFLNRSTNESYQTKREYFVFRAVHMQDRFAASVAPKPAGRKHEPVVDETSGIPSEGHYMLSTWRSDRAVFNQDGGRARGRLADDSSSRNGAKSIDCTATKNRGLWGRAF